MESVYGKWQPKKNLLNDFSTSTYTISLYMLTSAQYEKIVKEGKRSVKGLTLFAQSGGITEGEGRFGASRSEFFPDDYYIDNFQISSLLSGGGSMGPHNTYKMDFTLTETNGITLFQRLAKMVTTKSGDPKATYASQIFMSVIRFYGYDANGMPQTMTSAGLENSDETAIMEKYIPFMFTGIKFKLDTNKVIYSCNAVTPTTGIANSVTRGVLPSHCEVRGKTLCDVIYGKQPGSPFPKSSKNVTGLLDILHANGLAKQKDMKVKPDKYFITIDDKIANAKMKWKGTQSSTKSAAVAGSSVNNPGALKKEGNALLGMDTKRFQQGQHIINAISELIDSSTFVTDQVTTKNSESNVVSTPVKNSKKLGWYRIETSVIPFGNTDVKTNDKTYEIHYHVKYVEPSIDNNRFSDSILCKGTHKAYNYWFSGRNTEILNYSVDIDYMYYNQIDILHKAESKHTGKPTPDANQASNDINYGKKRSNVSPSSDKRSSGSNKNNAEAIAGIKSNLHSISDFIRVDMDILGDPDFIFQNEIFYSAIKVNKSEYKNSPFAEDGSVNQIASDIFFSIAFSTIVDYDLTLGIADQSKENVGDSDTQYAFMYRAVTIKSTFNEGSFKQRLEGVGIVNDDTKCITKEPVVGAK